MTTWVVGKVSELMKIQVILYFTLTSVMHNANEKYAEPHLLDFINQYYLNLRSTFHITQCYFHLKDENKTKNCFLHPQNVMDSNFSFLSFSS